MGRADEPNYLNSIAEHLLIETGYLVECPHGTLLVEGDDGSIEDAYKLANAKVSSGKIKLDQGITRHDLTNAIKSVADNAGDECYTCEKNKAE